MRKAALAALTSGILLLGSCSKPEDIATLFCGFDDYPSDISEAYVLDLNNSIVKQAMPLPGNNSLFENVRFSNRDMTLEWEAEVNYTTLGRVKHQG